ncbi:MAG: MBL fold metallo-hydrolase [Acidobacteria bacterium]|nr:MBL fold metallo-hydrolase [Acidobacteriota bacterium]
MRLGTCSLALLLAACLVTAAAEEPKPPMQVILLGTGYPRPDPERAGPATALVVGEKLFIVDAGRGVVLRLAAAELPAACGVAGSKCLRAVFLTHLHSDHTSGLPDLFTTSWIFGRHQPLELYGPKGTKEMAAALEKFFAADIRIRRDLTEMHPGAGTTLNAHTLKEGVVYEDSDVRITAFAVDHRPVVPVFGYRFDSGGKSVVISGDTRPSENLIKHAKGADILIHEAYLPEHFDRVDTPEVAARLKAYHSSAEEAGQVAAQAGVKLLVLTHLVPGETESERVFLERAGKHFKGKIVVGRDLLRF